MFCSIIVGLRSLNGRYLIPEFKAISGIYRPCIEILYYCLQTIIILRTFIPLIFSTSFNFIIIINHHFLRRIYYYILENVFLASTMSYPFFGYNVWYI